MAKKKAIKKSKKKTGGSAKKVARKKTSAKRGAKKSSKKSIKKTTKKAPAKKRTSPAKAKTVKKKAKKKTTARKKAPAKKVLSKKIKSASRKKAPAKKTSKPVSRSFSVKKKAVKKPVAKRKEIFIEQPFTESTVMPLTENISNAVHEQIHEESQVYSSNGSLVNENLQKDENNDQNDSQDDMVGRDEEEPFIAHITSLREGMIAPYFEGYDQNGNVVRSSDFPGKSVVLYFYPKDFTDGCTTEACNLRDEYQYLRDNNFVVVGVSADDVDSHRKFSNEYDLPFPIIADIEMNIIKDFDVWGKKQLAGHIYDGIVRTTFIIDADGIIRNIIRKVDNANAARQILSMI